MRRIIVVPAVIVGCMIVIWIGTVAASQMPPTTQLAPTLTASASAHITENDPIFNVDEGSLSMMHYEDHSCTLPTSYPSSILQWCFSIEENAQKTGIPASLIAAVILQESGGDPLAYFSSGAVGLMQIMPRDGIASEFMCVNGPCFAARPTIAELQDPVYNLAYGTQMLAALSLKTGSYREALFRYGPMDMGYAYADKVLAIWENYQ